MNTNPQDLDRAAAALEAAKQAEAEAIAARIAAEQSVLELTGCKDEGSATHHGALYKATVTGNVYRKVDEAALSAVRERMSEAMFERVFRFKPEVITAGVRYLQNNEPELYAIAAQAIVATPGKPSVRVERVESVANAA